MFIARDTRYSHYREDDKAIVFKTQYRDIAFVLARAFCEHMRVRGVSESFPMLVLENDSSNRDVAHFGIRDVTRPEIVHDDIPTTSGKEPA